ncbi:MAG: polysaccharide ABC transporter ATP-binding protein [Puniceicoccaceae bacterium]
MIENLEIGSSLPGERTVFEPDPSVGTGEVLIRVEGIGKRFCKDLKRSLFYGVQDVWNDLRGRGLDASELRKREFWANKDISFELRRGECLGLIGRNGAGKTTLLKMLNGLIKPDKGQIEIQGRVGALIALGAGFNPILTGRENVYVAASVYGLSKKEIDAKYDEIVAFAEMEEFMESPVQNYSSGMKVRLGFAVASSVKPDVMLIDEVLAVGDFSFRQRCLRKISELLSECAVIFVSHNYDQIERICTRGILLEKGQNLESGSIAKIKEIFARLGGDPDSNFWADARLSSSREQLCCQLEDRHLRVRLSINVSELIENVALRLRVKTVDGQYIAEYQSVNHGKIFRLGPGKTIISEDVRIPQLKDGHYSVDLFLNKSGNEMIKYLEVKPLYSFQEVGKASGYDPIQL